MNFHQVKQYITYALFSSSKYSNLHLSPYIKDYLSNVFENTISPTECNIIESYKNNRLKTNRSVVVTDYGATPGIKTRTLHSITKRNTIRKKYGQLLFKTAKFCNPHFILELGSSIGISASWISLGAPHAQITSVEGCPEIAKIAKETINNLQLSNIEIINEQFDNVLSELLNKKQQIDLAYLDGNHTYENTINYFNQLLPFCHRKTIIILDDIHWSEGMSKAWKEICLNKNVSYTIDIQQWGIVFFELVSKKENLVLRY